MKLLILCFINYFVISNCIEDSVFEFGGSEGEQVWNTEGSIGPTVENRRTVVHYTLPPCSKMSHIKVEIHNPRWRPSVSVDAVKQLVAIFYRYNHNSESTYKISVSAVTDTNCTSTSNTVDNSNGESNDSKPDGEYADNEEISEEEITTETREHTIQDTNEAQDADEDNKQESEQAHRLRAARLVPLSRSLRYGISKPEHCEYCCPGKGCPKVFYDLPKPSDFKPIDDESISARRKKKDRILLKKIANS